MSEILFSVVSELRGGHPDVPFAPGVDYAALVAGDDNPVFVTLPIGEVGATSTNGRKYPRTVVEELVRSVNEDQPGGIRGHMKAEERAHRFDLPSLMWVGATLSADGLAWGKAYVPQYAGDVREYILKSKARRSKVATSIYGTAEMEGNAVKRLYIESIDLADPARAGVRSAVAVPVITREMNDNPDENKGDNVETIQEVIEMRDTALKQATNLTQEVQTLKTQIAEMESQRTVLAEISGILSTKPESALDAVKTLVGEMVKLRTDMRTAAVDAALAKEVKLEALRGLVRDRIGDAADVPARIKEVMEMADVQIIARSLAVSEQGGRFVPGADDRQHGADEIKRRDEIAGRAQAKVKSMS
jgi:hypothetical protein